MKSLLSFLALTIATLLFCGAAQAQSNVTIYGVADVFVQWGKGDRTQYSLESGGLGGSRLGFKGSEDLGDGLKAVFQLEHGIALDTGGTNQGGLFWGRQAYVGFTGAFGSATLGRQYVPHFLTIDAADPFDTGAGSAANSGVISLSGVRADNAVVYSAPPLGSFTFTGMVSLAEKTGSNKFGNLYTTDMHFAPGALDIGVGLARLERPDAVGNNASFVLLTGSYDFKVVKVMGGVQSVKHLTQVANAKDDRLEYYGGVVVPVGTSTVTAAVYTGKTKDVDGTRATQFSLGYNYFLSKRTILYAVASNIKNGAATAYTPNAATGSGPTEVSLGQDARALQVGIQHKF